jgi:hypothetical protein
MDQPRFSVGLLGQWQRRVAGAHRKEGHRLPLPAADQTQIATMAAGTELWSRPGPPLVNSPVSELAATKAIRPDIKPVSKSRCLIRLVAAGCATVMMSAL